MNPSETDIVRPDATYWTRLRGALHHHRNARRSRSAFRDQLAGAAGDELKAMLEQA